MESGREHDEEPSRAFRPDASRGFGWYAYAPYDAEVDEVDDDPEISEVWLDHDEYAGPWRSNEGVLGDDYDELHRWLGISRQLYDDVMAWNDEAEGPLGHDPAVRLAVVELGRHLRERLRRELPPHIRVREPHERRPTMVYLLLMKVTARGVVAEPLDPRSRAARALSRLPHPLVERLSAWQEEFRSLSGGLPDDDPDVRRWTDGGRAIAAEIEGVVGPDHEVRLYPP